MQMSGLFPQSPHTKVISTVQDCLLKGDLKQAHMAVAERINQYPDAGVLQYLMSEIMMKAGRVDIAVPTAKRAWDSEPDNRHFQAHYSFTLLHAAQFDAALQTARNCWVAGVEHPLTADVLGSAFTGCGELAEALAAYQLAAGQAPDVSHFQFNLATALRAAGKLEEAEACYDRVIAATPQDWEAYRNRADLRIQTPTSNHVAEMKACLPQAEPDPRGAYQLCGALAKELADLEDYDESWHYLKHSADLRRSMMDYSVDGDVATMKALSRAHDADLLGQGGGCDSEEPIFILGLPRTGSTLLERMLSSHSDVYAAGELQNFVTQFMNLARSAFQGEKLDKLSLVDKSTRLDFAKLGRDYIDSTRPRTGHTRFFIDKMPMNFLYAGLIHLALPKARIIHLTRHPMDACYAIYKTSFDQAYPFSYDLGDMAKYYVAYRGLMDHWNRAMPGRIFNLAYEDLVTDTAEQLNHVLDYCGLQFQSVCLEFHKSKTPTNTASAAQVRQPIYTSSVGKWRHVEEGLAPFKGHLLAAGIDIS